MIVAITGTSRGIGRALACHLAERGDRVFGCARGPVGIEHENYTHVVADLALSDGPKEFFRQIRRTEGRLDALINNAASALMNHFMLTPEDSIKQLFGLNLQAMLGCCREAVGLMSKTEYPAPSIVSFSSVAVCWSLPGQLVYAASKSAVEQATRSMSRELGAQNIRVNAIGLPPVRTALTRTVPHHKIEALIARQALPRQCEMTDIFGPVEFLLSTAARFVTGETIYLGGVH
ncbi:MAG TPA: SDR family oxidoreductase [Polyangiaceae bacterium]|nr:SDR family oxidoreductase [Polyangiaceae bacterium]